MRTFTTLSTVGLYWRTEQEEEEEVALYFVRSTISYHSNCWNAVNTINSVKNRNQKVMCFS